LPTNDLEKTQWLQLIRSRRVGPETFRRLLAEFGNVSEALAHLPEIASASGVKSYRVYPYAEAEKEYAAANAAGAELLCLGADPYPIGLTEISDAPPILWAKGRVELGQTNIIALVGARNASSLGTRMAKRLASDLGCHGFTIASGLARGVDAAAHSAALNTGTIAVMAGGVDYVYPPQNQKLADEIADLGLMLSEQPIGLAPQARHFPRRNRLISGLAQAVVVVEGAAKSGSLITARDALDQGREVMAVPGHPLDARAAGCNMLIRDGATLVRGSKDIITALGHAVAPTHAEVPSKLSHPVEPLKATIPEALELSKAILSHLGTAPIAEDQLIRDLALPPQVISTQLLNLEMDGKLARERGGMLTLVV
jgi:DNA processing protein